MFAQSESEKTFCKKLHLFARYIEDFLFIIAPPYTSTVSSVHIRFYFQFLFVLLFLIFAFRAVDEAGLGF